MKKNKFTIDSPELFEFNRNSHVLFVWTGYAHKRKFHNYSKVTHIVFNGSHYVFAVGQLENQEMVVEKILNYLEQNAEISDESFKDRLYEIYKYYLEDIDDHYCVKIGGI